MDPHPVDTGYSAILARFVIPDITLIYFVLSQWISPLVHTPDFICAPLRGNAQCPHRTAWKLLLIYIHWHPVYARWTATVNLWSQTLNLLPVLIRVLAQTSLTYKSSIMHEVINHTLSHQSCVKSSIKCEVINQV